MKPSLSCIYVNGLPEYNDTTQIAKFMGPTWGPPGSCRPQMGPMLAPWTLLSGNPFKYKITEKNTDEQIFARRQSSVGYMMLHVDDKGPD